MTNKLFDYALRDNWGPNKQKLDFFDKNYDLSYLYIYIYIYIYI